MLDILKIVVSVRIIKRFDEWLKASLLVLVGGSAERRNIILEKE